MITIMDYGVRKPTSIHNMLRALKAKCVISSDPESISAGQHLILPGYQIQDLLTKQLSNKVA